MLGFALSQLGSGMTFPFLIVYMHQVRGMSLPVAGVVLATLAAVGAVSAPLAGAVGDRLGLERALVAALLVACVGTASWMFVHHPWQAFIAAAVLGVGINGIWSLVTAVISATVERSQRSSALALNFALLNLGLGIGGLIAGLVVNVHQPRTFDVVFGIDAASFVAFALVLPRVEVARERVAGGGYRIVLRDRVLLRTLLVNALIVVFAYSQLASGFSALAADRTSTRIVGYAFTANTFTIVLLQAVSLRILRGRRRTDAAAAATLVFAAAWVLVAAAAHARYTLAATAFVVSLAIFAIGETLLSPTLIALVNDVAPDALRGRYNAVFQLSWQIGPVLGPTIAGVALGARHGSALFLGLALACLLTGVYAQRLRHVVPEDANVV